MLSSESSINCSSNIKDHWSHTIMTNKMKKLDIAWELLKCDKETWSEQRFLEKWHQATKLKLVRKAISSKHNKPKCNKMRCAYIEGIYLPITTLESRKCFPALNNRGVIIKVIIKFMLFLFLPSGLQSYTAYCPVSKNTLSFLMSGELV